MSQIPRISVTDDPLNGTTQRPETQLAPAPAHPVGANRQVETNVSARVPAELARGLKIAAAELSATRGRVKVAELLTAILAEHVGNYRDEHHLEQLGRLVDAYRAR